MFANSNIGPFGSSSMICFYLYAFPILQNQMSPESVPTLGDLSYKQRKKGKVRHGQRVGPPDPELKTYLKALDQLSERFDATAAVRVSQIFPQQVFVWLYQLEEDSVRLLQAKRPIALVVLSYFCILLDSVRSFWWNRGWMEHLLSEIHSSLNQEYRIWMQRPMEETGWISG
jgi:hypothetical protein